MGNKLFHLLRGISERIKDELLLFSFAVVLVLTFLPTKEARLFILSVYLVGSLTYTWLRIKKVSKTDFSEPKIYLDITKRVDRYLLEIVNIGEEDVVGFKGKMKWNQKIGIQERDLYSFIGENDDPIMTHPKNIGVLKKGERVYALNVPLHSVDGNISVTITGIGSKSNKPLHYVVSVKNEKRGTD